MKVKKILSVRWRWALLKFEQQFVARRGTVCRKLPKSERRRR